MNLEMQETQNIGKINKQVGGCGGRFGDCNWSQAAGSSDSGNKVDAGYGNASSLSVRNLNLVSGSSVVPALPPGAAAVCATLFLRIKPLWCAAAAGAAAACG
jgi:hypothetical protein